MAERVFPMPDLGEGLEDAEIVAWRVAVGDRVALNQPLVEVETAKATVEIPSPVAGRIAALHAEAGATVAVGAPLVTFELEEADAGARVAATPPVRRLAKELGVDLAGVRGTGPGGRITAEDVRAAAGAPSPGSRRVPVDPTRRRIAENLERQAAIPQVTTFRTLDCSALEALRAELRVSPLPIVVAALAATVRDHPMINATWAGDAIEVHGSVDVGIAVDTERGLLVPVLRAAQDLGIAEIAAGIARLADAARAGSIAPADLTGATIAVSNTGSYGSEAGTPLLAPGTAATLALGRIEPRPLVVDGAVVARPAVTLSLTFDHRVLDGAAAGRALSALVERLRSPDRLRDLPR
ncbi:MAG: dihydrolipoamide acetyltransferase component of pyruvate dehydrogenase complex [Actinomycetota bacterium]|nr:MAG: dihydrolipoamide acetyltransferase component of pyruvate dehydrogenase complex [Actinomycetota bacterium]